jgi:hypothetical protein
MYSRLAWNLQSSYLSLFSSVITSTYNHTQLISVFLSNKLIHFRSWSVMFLFYRPVYIAKYFSYLSFLSLILTSFTQRINLVLGAPMLPNDIFVGGFASLLLLLFTSHLQMLFGVVRCHLFLSI